MKKASPAPSDTHPGPPKGRERELARGEPASIRMLLAHPPLLWRC